jgi:glycosyltransferase involved in cell wall biosynthesis
MPNPQISIIVPTYNRDDFLPKAIQSILNQTYQDWEAIIVDDGSTDKTEEIVKGYKKSRIRYIAHKSNLGISTARNTGIKNSKGKYIALLDSDDEWFPEKLSCQMKTFQEEDLKCGVVCTSGYMVKDDKVLGVKAIPADLDNFYEKFLFENITWCSSVLIRKECFEKLGLFDEHLDGCEDWEMWIRISKYYKFIFLKTPLIKYLIHSGQISENLSAKIEARKWILFKYQDELKNRKFVYSHHYYKIGNLCCLSGKIREGRKYLFKGILAYPFCLKYFLCLLLSLFGFPFYSFCIEKKRFIIRKSKTLMNRLLNFKYN